MPVVAVPNLSEARDAGFVKRAVSAAGTAGSRVLDVHGDARHNRTVLTIAPASVESVVSLATACKELDLRKHQGVHPRLGVLDVCPFVPFEETMESAEDLARRAGRAIGKDCALPVYLYGSAATREETKELPDLRRGGLGALIERSKEIPPDFGPSRIDPRHGVVCVGARGPLIAFNVWVRTDMETADRVAEAIRARNSGLSGVRALGLDLGAGWMQISMNLTQPERAGIDEVYAGLEELLDQEGLRAERTEIVGLVEERFAPDPKEEAARLLLQPGRTLESALSLAGGPPGGTPPPC